MIRHGSSFSISLAFHVLVVLLVVFLYNYVSAQMPPKRVSVNLSTCTIDCGCGCMPSVEKKPKEAVVPKEEPKKVEKKTLKKKELKKVPHVTTKERVATNEVQEEIAPESKAQETQDVQSAEAPALVSEEKAEDTSIEDAKRLQEYKKAMQKQYVNENLSKIIQMLKENLFYPLRARKRGIEGDVVVKFTLLKNSNIKDVMIVKHSNDILDASAIHTIQNLQGKLPAPVEEMVLEVPINYRLN
ncbi:energy transducer TonB [bacterium]|nr:energy transducer TonB [bacterium]MBU1883503.1 energy transducer TonB [bacterium]